MNRKEDTVFCYYAHNSVWTCELGYGANTMFHKTYFLLLLLLLLLRQSILYLAYYSYTGGQIKLPNSVPTGSAFSIVSAFYV